MKLKNSVMKNRVQVKDVIHFLNQMEKVASESEKEHHPDYETIYLFAENRDEESGADRELAEHLDYCIDCGEIFADALLSMEIEKEVAEGKLAVNYKMPDLRAMLQRRTDERAQDTADDDPGLFQRLCQAIMAAVASLGGGAVPALAAATEDSTQRTPLLDDGKEVGWMGFSREYDKTIVYLHINKDLSNRIISCNFAGQQKPILSVLTQRSEYESEGVSSRFEFLNEIDAEDLLPDKPRFFEAKSLNAAFADGSINKDEIHASITATDNAGKRAWRSLAANEDIGEELRQVILSHQVFQE